MSGGGPKNKPVQTEAPDIEPVPAANIPVAQGPAFGPTATPNPYVAGNAPSWATGWFSMPWWGKDPFGGDLSQAQMQYQPPPPPPPPQVASPFGGNYTPRPAGSSWMDQYKAGVMSREDATRMLRYQGFDPVQAERRLNMTVRHPLARRDRWGNNDVG